MAHNATLQQATTAINSRTLVWNRRGGLSSCSMMLNGNFIRSSRAQERSEFLKARTFAGLRVKYKRAPRTAPSKAIRGLLVFLHNRPSRSVTSL